MTDDQTDLFKSAALPDGDYAIVELLGHRTLIGRVTEIERFGTKMLQIEPIFQGRLLTPVLHGGGSIYAFTPCSKESAARSAPTGVWQLPVAIRETLPVTALSAPHQDDSLDADVPGGHDEDTDAEVSS